MSASPASPICAISVYGKIVQQPVGFFHHNPVGRVMSAVINDIEQMRTAFSDYLADFFRQIFSLSPSSPCCW